MTPTKPTSRKAIGYARCSTDKQDTKLEVQEEKIKLYCQLNGLELVAILYEPAVSAKKRLYTRKEGSKITKHIESGVTNIVAMKLDRLFRNAGDALGCVEEWDKAGVALHLVDMGGQSINTASSMGKMMLTMLAGFAEFERNLISERTSQTLQFKKAHRKVYNHVPYGYVSEDGQLIPDATEQAVIAEMGNLRSNGVSLNQIAAKLNANGTQTKTGKVWHAQTVKQILALAA
jgi:DNA invertase Pin-like site-specific DNA recombinase